MRFFISLLFAILALSATAQTAEQIKSYDKEFQYELYRPYPVEYIDVELSKAPKGYKPFYINHLSRHGSRWHSSSKSYSQPLNVLAAAAERRELTPVGMQLYADVQRIVIDAQNRYGELSQVGFEQHRGIAARMVENFPEVFHKNCYIDCKSTIVPRCILSMAAAVEEIKSRVPSAKIRMESSEDNTYLKAYAGLNSVKQDAIPLSDSLQSAYLPDTKPFMQRIFTKEQNIDEQKFMLQTYMLNAILGSTPVIGVKNIEYAFSDSEMTDIWRASNIRRYALTGPSKPFAEAILEGIKPFVAHFIQSAEEAMENNQAASLRFAHDVTIIPFTAILGIKGCNIITDDWDNVSKYWRINQVTPMGANVQMIFYRSKTNPDILVKILHNEKEQILDLTEVKPVEGVYYRWDDICEYLISKL